MNNKRYWWSLLILLFSALLIVACTPSAQPAPDSTGNGVGIPPFGSNQNGAFGTATPPIRFHNSLSPEDQQSGAARTPQTVIGPDTSAQGVPITGECSQDLTFYTAAQVQVGMQVSFDSPEDFDMSLLDKNRRIDLGDQLEVVVNGSPINNYWTALFDQNRPNRLYIVSDAIRRGDRVTVRLRQQACHTSVQVSIPRNLTASDQNTSQDEDSGSSSGNSSTSGSSGSGSGGQQPTAKSTATPTTRPTEQPTIRPTAVPVEPTEEPTVAPTTRPSEGKDDNPDDGDNGKGNDDKDKDKDKKKLTTIIQDLLDW